MMADLIAQGAQASYRWRRKLPDDQSAILGRAAGAFSVPWDEQISRQHVEVRWNAGKLTVTQLESGRNAVYFRGKESKQFELRPSEHFVIGETRFMVTADAAGVSMDVPQPAEEHTYSSQDLQRIRFRNADHRIDVLSRLPDVISGAATDSELFVRLVNMLLSGISRADLIALVATEAAPDVADKKGASGIRILHWDRRLAHSGDFRPSEKLIREAIENRKQSVLHVWKNRTEPALPVFTLSENVDWAYCSPVPGKANAGWGIYVAGRFASQVPQTPTPTDSTDLRDDLKFTELVAAILSSLRQARQLQRQHAELSQFLSPRVVEALDVDDPDTVLKPRTTQVTVLFCDLRGFSRESERSADDLMGLLNRVSGALGVATRHILEHAGVVGDFQGDAVMGFWGWPLAQADAVEQACKAALGIRTEFEAAAREAGNPLADFRIGVGIATGTAVAGKIGTVNQVKVTVFGPVVNLASRLEGMTKLVSAPILLDETTAKFIRERVPKETARTRRVAVVKPYGLDTTLSVTELLPPVAEYPQLSDQNIADYEAALDALIAGKWAQAFELLHRVPPDDQVKDFLTVFIAQRNRTPPPGWDGVIPLLSKS